MHELVLTAFNNVEFPIGVSIPSHNKNWKILFDYYNGENNTNLSTTCRPCYGKVYYYVKQRMQHA